MEFALEFLLQFCGEFLLQALFEVLVELGQHSFADSVRRPRHPLLSTIGFILWGAIFGGLSLLIFPTSPIENPLYRQINLVLTPILVGGLMMLVGKLREGRGQSLVRLDRFGFAFVFAFSMALVRFLWAG